MSAPSWRSCSPNTFLSHFTRIHTGTSVLIYKGQRKSTNQKATGSNPVGCTMKNPWRASRRWGFFFCILKDAVKNILTAITIWKEILQTYKRFDFRPASCRSQLVDISKLGLNSKIKKFGYSFICGKGYSPPFGGRIAFCLQSATVFGWTQKPVSLYTNHHSPDNTS